MIGRLKGAFIIFSLIFCPAMLGKNSERPPEKQFHCSLAKDARNLINIEDQVFLAEFFHDMDKAYSVKKDYNSKSSKHSCRWKDGFNE